jgi:hypothetical protein
MIVSARTPPEDLAMTRLTVSARPLLPVADRIPTVREAKRRLAAAGPDPWLTADGIAALGEAEQAAGGWLLGAANSQPATAD